MTHTVHTNGEFPPLEFVNTPCTCVPGHCAKFVEPASECVNRLEGEVETRSCSVCSPDGKGFSWHHNGQCLRCKYNRECAGRVFVTAT